MQCQVEVTLLVDMTLCQQQRSPLHANPLIPFRFSHCALWCDTLSLGKQLRKWI